VQRNFYTYYDRQKDQKKRAPAKSVHNFRANVKGIISERWNQKNYSYIEKSVDRSITAPIL